MILDEKGSVVQGDIGPFNELSTLILTCDVLGGEFGRISQIAIRISKHLNQQEMQKNRQQPLTICTFWIDFFN